MSQFETFSDLKIAALDRAGEITNGTSDYDQSAEEQINNLFRSLYSGANEFNVDLGEPWEWAKAPNPGVLSLIPPYATGTISVTQGSANVDLSVAPTGLGSFKNYWLFISDRMTGYRIASHVADDTSLLLDGEYLEATGAALNFKLIKLDYELTANIERLIGPMRYYGANLNEDGIGEISGIEAITFDRAYPRSHLQAGCPERFMVVSEINGVITVRFSHYVATDKLRVEYEYIPKALNLVVKTFVNTDVDITTDTIAIANHGFKLNQQVKLTTTSDLPTGLALDTAYFIVGVATGSFQLATSADGVAIDLTGVGNDGTHTISNIPTVPHSHRKVLFYAATHFIMTDKNDSRSDYYMRLTQAGLQALVSSNRKAKQHVSKNRGKLITRPEQRSSFAARIPRVFD